MKSYSGKGMATTYIHFINVIGETENEQLLALTKIKFSYISITNIIMLKQKFVIHPSSWSNLKMYPIITVSSNIFAHLLY